jgi:oligopeptide transport system substrate-binding protein
MRGNHRGLRISLWLTLALACFGATAADPEQTVRRSGIGDASTLDPHRWVDGWEGNIVMDLFQGLTTLDAEANVVPGVASSWQVSEDGKSYVFELRKDARWSDGVAVTADDVVFSFRRILDPQTASPAAALLYLIKNGEAINGGSMPIDALGVTAIDPTTVAIELTEPAPYFPELIVHRGLLAPRHVIEGHGQRWARPGTMVSNGAFVLDEWIPQVHVRLVRNPEFHSAGEVRLEVMYHMPSEDLSTGLKRYRAGEIDILGVIPPGRLQWVRENLPADLHLTSILGLDYYVFNVSKPPFDDQRVRLALSMALNREVITQKITRAGEAPAYGLVPPGVFNYPNPARAKFADMPHNERVKQARALLAEAGFGASNPLAFTLRYNTNEQHKRVAVAASAMWKQLGVRVSLLNNEMKVLVADIRAGDFEMARASWFAEVRDAMTYLDLLHSTSGPINQSGYNSSSFDSLVNQARASADLEARAKLMRQAEQMAVDAQPIMPLNFYMARNLVKPRVKGWVDNNRGIHLGRYFYVEK